MAALFGDFLVTVQLGDAQKQQAETGVIVEASINRVIDNRELAGTQVLLEDDPAYQFDEIGRRLYYAYTADASLSIEAVLVGEGSGRAVRTDAREGAYLAALEDEARAASRGCLWASPSAGE